MYEQNADNVWLYIMNICLLYFKVLYIDTLQLSVHYPYYMHYGLDLYIYSISVIIGRYRICHQELITVLQHFVALCDALYEASSS